MSVQYLEQFERIKRWHQRLEEIYVGREHDRSTDYYQDVLYAFFQNCFYLRDWLINSGAVSKIAIDNLINADEDMKMCRDLCNGSKHLMIRDPSIDPNIKVKNKDIALELGAGMPQIKIIYWIEARGGVYHAFDVATRCLVIWKRFLTQHSLIKDI